MARKKTNPEQEQNEKSVLEEQLSSAEQTDNGQMDSMGEQANENNSFPELLANEESQELSDGGLPEADSIPGAESQVTEAQLGVQEEALQEEGKVDVPIDLTDVEWRDTEPEDGGHRFGPIPSVTQPYADVPEELPVESEQSADEKDWGFHEEHQEPEPLAEEVKEVPTKSERQQFYELKFHELDRDLTVEERQEWNSIYASYRGRSAISGTIIGVDPLSIYVRNAESGNMEKQTMYCAIVVPYRVRIVIPASEMWTKGQERPDFVLKNMVGASIDFIIIKVDRENGFAIASRRLACRSQRYFFAHRENLHRIGARVSCQILAVGPRRCLVECYGHDIDMTQREMRYASIPDLRDEYHPGMKVDCIVKVFDPVRQQLEISVKETEVNPFLGAEERHPVGARRLAVISGKYGGGVFCNLPDGVVCMCNYSYQHEDADFMVGEHVMLLIQRYENSKRQIYGKIMSKW